MPIPRAHARLMMVLKLLSLGRGASGVRWELIELIEAMLARGVTPVIPAQGSVGASGDLAPLAHMTAVHDRRGRGDYRGQGHARRAGPCRRRPCPDCPWPERGSGLHQRHPVFHRLRAGRAVRRLERRAIGAGHLGACPPMRSWGQPRPCSPKSTPCAAMQARSNAAGFMRALLDGLGDPRKPPSRATPACRTPIASAASRR